MIGVFDCHQKIKFLSEFKKMISKTIKVISDNSSNINQNVISIAIH